MYEMNTSERHFSVKLDGLSKALTLIVLLVLIIPFVSIASMMAKSGDILLLIGPALVLIGIVMTVSFRPTGYVLDRETLRLQRPAGDIRIPLREIVSIEPITIKDLGFGVRTFASGGFLGYFGKFWYRKLGHVTLYATDRSKLILLKLASDKKYIISPDDGPAFIAAIREVKG